MPIYCLVAITVLLAIIRAITNSEVVVQQTDPSADYAQRPPPILLLRLQQFARLHGRLHDAGRKEPPMDRRQRQQAVEHAEQFNRLSWAQVEETELLRVRGL